MQYRELWSKYPVMPVAVMLAVGIVLGDVCWDVVPLWVWAANMVLLVTAVSVFPLKPWIQGAGIYLATLFFGVWICAGSRQQLQVTLPDGPMTYEAVVSGDVRERGATRRCDLLVLTSDDPIKVRAIFACDTLPLAFGRLRVGDGVRVRSVLEPVDYVPDGGRFNYRRWLLSHGYHATTYVGNGAWQPQRVSLISLSLLTRTKIAALRFRDDLVARYAKLGWEDRTLALLSSMTLGDRSALTDVQRDDYSVTGGSHIMALSGLHVGLIYVILLTVVGGAVSLIRRLTCRDLYLSGRIVVQVVALFAIWSYVMLAGCPPSVVRAATMVTIYGMVTVLNRSRLSLNTLAVAAMVMLVTAPQTLWDVGFQMSFMAVLSIVLLYPRRRLWGLFSVLWVTLSAQIGVAPLILYYFGRFSCYFLLANLLVVPCATVLLYGVAAVWLLTPLPMLQQGMADAVALLAGWMDAGVAWIASLPGASVEGVNVNAVQVVAIYVLIFCVCQIISLILHRK